MKHPLLIILFIVPTVVFSQFKSVEDKNIPLDQISKQSSKILSQVKEGESYKMTSSFNPVAQYQKQKFTGLTTYGRNQYDGVKYIQSGSSFKGKDIHTILNDLSQAVRVKMLQENVEVIEQWTDDIGQKHYKIQQVIEGLPLYGSESIIHIKQDGKLFVQSNLKVDKYPVSNKSTSFSVNDAITIAKENTIEFVELDEKELQLIPQEQVKSEEIFFTKKNGEIVHAYLIELFPNVGEHLTYVIESKSGSVINKYSHICKLHSSNCQEHALMDGAATATANDLFGIGRQINTYEAGNSYYLLDASRTMFDAGNSTMPNEPVGVIWTIDAFNTSPQNNNFSYDHVSSNNNSWSGKETAVSAHYNGGRAYEYFKTTHNRESVDGSGGNVISIINVSDQNGNSMGNAFWNGLAIFYGNGDSNFKPLGLGLDVAGHELSHGVVQNTANLEYQGESGALNESFADIFGAMIDRDDWLIGEDVVKPGTFPSGALRSMSDPHNGASTGDYNGGWQPKHYSERFTGSQDNGGVHINSGIPNYAYYLFATAVGKDMAERVYYRALTTYLTRSSQFADCRVAVVQAAEDIGNASVVNAANEAWDAVGVGAGAATSYEQDAETNLGEDFIVYADAGLNKLVLSDASPAIIVDPFVEMGILSKPSVTDDGSTMVFVGDDNRIYRLDIDWTAGQYNYEVFDNQQIWRNVVISKDGARIAAIAQELESVIYVYDFSKNETRPFNLYNPTYSEGVSTGDVLYSDAMEFDLSGQFLMYDANNEINGGSGEITYWDIGFLNVWNRSANNWADGNIDKLFSALPENVSIGNPTFAKNSPYIIAFDVLEDGLFGLLGYNIETGDVGTLMELTGLGYPSYSRTDDRVIFDNEWIFGIDLGVINTASDKINSVSGSDAIFIESAKWGTWFSNGDRDLYSDVADDDVLVDQVAIYPNPASDQITIEVADNFGIEASYRIINSLGQQVHAGDYNAQKKIQIDDLNPGIYTVEILSDSKIIAIGTFVK